jgi:hypothetical protein
MITELGAAVPSSIITRPLTKMGGGMLTAAGVPFGLVVVGEGVVVRPGMAPPPVLPVVPPVPVVGGAVVPPVLWQMTATGNNKPAAAAAAIALTQFFEAIPPPLTAYIIPP